ncbi:MAG: hypothetical protein RR177_00810 [Oscillospiraceae bacterium]
MSKSKIPNNNRPGGGFAEFDIPLPIGNYISCSEVGKPFPLSLSVPCENVLK